MSDAAPTCQEIAELVTDYLEGALSAARHALFELHLAGCRNCTLYVAQMRATVAVAGRLSAADIPPEIQGELLAAFRTWAAETS